MNQGFITPWDVKGRESLFKVLIIRREEGNGFGLSQGLMFLFIRSKFDWALYNWFVGFYICVLLQDLDCFGFIVKWIILVVWRRWGRIRTKWVGFNFVLWSSLRVSLACECHLASQAALGASPFEQEDEGKNWSYGCQARSRKGI